MPKDSNFPNILKHIPKALAKPFIIFFKWLFQPPKDSIAYIVQGLKYLFRHTMKAMNIIFDFTDKVLMVICKILLIIDILITSMAVAGRYISFLPDPMWSEEIVLTAMSYMAVLSAAIALRHHRHIRMSAFDKWLPKTLVRVLDLLADVCVLAFGVFMVVLGMQYATTLGARGFYISIPSLSRFWAFFPIPLAGICMIVFEIEIIIKHIKVFFEDDGACPPEGRLTEDAKVALDEAHVSIDTCQAKLEGGDVR